MNANDDLDPRFLHGVELFNRREFFDCHEILEGLWKEQKEPERQLTQGIIQIAVAYYHILRGNRAGALKLFSRGIPRVKPFLPNFAKLRLAEFIAAVEQDFATISLQQDSCELFIPRLESSSEA